MAQSATSPMSAPTTLTTENHPFPKSTLSSKPSSPLSGSLTSGSIPASITPQTTLSSTTSSNGTFNSTATTSTVNFAWDCSSGAPSRASLFENFSGCTYAQSATTPTARPSNATTANGTISGGAPLPTANMATGLEFGGIGALGLVFVAMMGWL